jgi:phosphoglycolate phosphatase
MGELWDPPEETRKEDAMAQNQPIRAIIFDFDGTLADTRRPIMQCFWEVLINLNIPLPPNLSANEFFCQTLEDSLRSIDGMSEDQMHGAMKHFNSRYPEIAKRTAKLFPHVSNTLRSLKKSGLSLGIATNESRRNLNKLVEKLKIGTFIHQSVCHDEVLQSKPSPDMALKTLRAFGVEPRDALVVGDSILDIDMGKAAGCRTCAVTHGVHTLAELASHTPNWVIDEISDLLHIVASDHHFEKMPAANRKAMALS